MTVPAFIHNNHKPRRVGLLHTQLIRMQNQC